MNQTTATQTTIGGYLLKRLYDYGVRHIFGVPGDYVLRLDKLIENSPIQFINTTRENTAGYAADAYARASGSLGVACITYGVGINIANALSQAYVEGSPLVVVSGTIGTHEFPEYSFMHHLINKSHTTHSDTTQLEIFKHVTIDQGVLEDPKTAAIVIDRVLNVCMKNKKPVYFEIPRDMVDREIEIPERVSFPVLESDHEALLEALNEAKEILLSCRHPLIWAGHEMLRFGLSDAILKFAERHQIPIVSSLLGKTVVGEHHPLFAGIYQGGMSAKEVINLVERCDCALILGVILTDLDTGIFTAKLNQEHRILATNSALNIGHHYFHDVKLADFIQGLCQLEVSTSYEKIHHPFKERAFRSFRAKEGTKTTTRRIFECLQSHLKPEHFLVTDVGDCLFGSADLMLPWNSFIACAYFASLGFGIPAAIGVAIALPHRRVVAIVGDGGFQMTSMELSQAIRYGLDPIIIVLNNHGYGTERPLLEGEYNDILNWNYSEIPRVLGGGVGVRVTNEEAFEKALSEGLEKRGAFHLIEVELDKTDFSPALHRLGELLNKVV